MVVHACAVAVFSAALRAAAPREATAARERREAEAAACEAAAARKGRAVQNANTKKEAELKALK